MSKGGVSDIATMCNYISVKTTRCVSVFQHLGDDECMGKVYFFDRKKVGTFFHSLISRGSWHHFSSRVPGGGEGGGTSEVMWSARTRVKLL